VSLSADRPAVLVIPTDVEGVDFLRLVGAVAQGSSVVMVVGFAGDAHSRDLAYQALRHGARGLIALPFTAEQLALVVRRLGLPRTFPALPVSYGPIVLDRQRHRVLVDNQPVHVSPREFTLLEYLVNEAPRVVSVEEIVEVMGEPCWHPHPIRVRKHVQKIRRAVDAARPGYPTLIHNVRGVGYQLSV